MWISDKGLPPPYADLDSANQEIRRLQKELVREREKRAQQVVDAELTKRSLVGEVRKLRLQLGKPPETTESEEMDNDF